MAPVANKATPTSARRRKSPRKSRSEDSKCGGCSILVRNNQSGMCCELCNTWFHIGCQNVSLAEYRLYSDEDCKAKWFCLKCDKVFRTLKTENEALRVENSELKEKNNKLMEQGKDLEEKDTVDEEVQIEAQGKEEQVDKTVQTEKEVTVAEKSAESVDKTVQTEKEVVIVAEKSAEESVDKSSQTKAKGAVVGPRTKKMRKRMAPIRIVGDSMVKKTQEYVRCELKDSGCTSMSGARIGEVKRRVQEEASVLKDGLLVIQGGGNGLECVGKDETVEEMLEAVKAVKGKNMSVAVVGVLRRPQEDPQYEWLRRATNRKLQEELVKLKIEWKREKHGDVSFIDMDQVLRDNRFFSRDGVHLNDEGNERMGRRLCEWVRAKSMQAIDTA